MELRRAFKIADVFQIIKPLWSVFPKATLHFKPSFLAGGWEGIVGPYSQGSILTICIQMALYNKANGLDGESIAFRFISINYKTDSLYLQRSCHIDPFPRDSPGLFGSALRAAPVLVAPFSDSGISLYKELGLFCLLYLCRRAIIPLMANGS